MPSGNWLVVDGKLNINGNRFAHSIKRRRFTVKIGPRTFKACRLKIISTRQERAGTGSYGSYVTPGEHMLFFIHDGLTILTPRSARIVPQPRS
jgi:hypothetical protein